MKIYANVKAKADFLQRLAGKDLWVRVRIDERYGDYYLKVIRFIDTKHQSAMFWRFAAKCIPASCLTLDHPKTLSVDRFVDTVSLWVMDIYVVKPEDILSEDELCEAFYSGE